MRLVMIDADERFVQRKRQRLRRLETNQQRDAQTRPLRGRDGVKLLCGNFGLTQSRLRDGQKIFQMFPRREFGNDAAVFRVEFYLRRNHIRQDTAIAHDGGAGFITGSFDAEYKHYFVSRFYPRETLN